MKKTTIEIDGMMCGMCESHINDAVRNAFDVKKVTSSHKKGVTEIISLNELDRKKLCSVIEDTGYKVKKINTEEYEKRSLFSFLK